jgi:dynein heavy chain, axonemal
MPFAIEPSFNESSCTTPLIFVLSPGSDPMAALLKFADDRGVRAEAVSLGQGQGPIAQLWISKGLKEGFWVVRAGCWLPAAWYAVPICMVAVLPGHDCGLRRWIARALAVACC